MKITKKCRLLCASLLAMCCFGTAAAGFALTGTVASADASANWNGLPAKSSAVGDEIMTVSQNVAMVEKTTDITKLPNRTGVFYMYYTDSVDWSGFSFRNGNDNVGYSWKTVGDAAAFPWHTVAFGHENNHMILNDTRTFTNEAGTHGGINGTEGENFKDGMVPVEVHLGEGADKGDPSYIKIGGVNLIHEQTETTSVTQVHSRETGTSKELVASMFDKGCYLAVNYNGQGDPFFAITSPGSVVALDQSMDMTEAELAGKFSKDLTMNLSSSANVFASGCKVTAKLNGKALSDINVALNRTDDTHATLTVSQAELNKIPKNDFESTSFLVFSFQNGETDYGDVAVALNILFEDPPVFEKTEITLEQKQAFDLSFTYGGEADPEHGTTISYQATSSSPETALASPADFTVTKEGQKYTIHFTQECANKLFGGHASTILLIKFGKHKIRVTAYVEGATTEWGVRYREGIDYLDGTLKQDKFYSSATMHIHDPQLLASRIFYENSVPVDQPIFIDFGAMDPRVAWTLISLMNTPTLSEEFSNEKTAAQGNTVCFILFGQSPSIQGMQGTFVDGNTKGLMTEYPTMKNNVVEISLGKTDPAEGYVKINGEEVENALTRSQKDFPDGKAWVGFFFNNGKVEFDFTVNTHINPVVVGGPQEDSAYAMDLGNANDFTVDLLNTSGSLTLTDESGAVLPTADWSYQGGKLTVKKSYFENKSFSREGEIFIWDNERETGTSFRMAYSNSGMATVNIASAIQGALQDVTFDLGVSSVEQILQGGEKVDPANYTVEGGKLIIKKEALKDETSVQEFLVTAGGKLYPCYVHVNNWQNGYALGTGASKTESGLLFNGVSDVSVEKVYDLTQELNFTFDFKTVQTYYESGVNLTATNVTLKFYDPFSSTTLQISVYANFADDKVTSANNALYLRCGLLNAEGMQKGTWIERKVAPKDGNTSASGAHGLDIKEKDGGLTITLAGRPYTLNADTLAGFNLKTCIFTATTEKSTSGSVAELSFTKAVTDPGDDNPGTTPGGDNPGTTPGGDNPGGDNPGEDEGGCGAVAFGGTVGAIVALCTVAFGVAVVLFVRRKEEK